ncbi:hypothetical protein ACTXT7_004809 [Hymenolepis weldensis]
MTFSAEFPKFTLSFRKQLEPVDKSQTNDKEIQMYAFCILGIVNWFILESELEFAESRDC